MRTLKDYLPAMISAFKKRKGNRLRKLNDHILEDAAIDSSKVNFKLAIISYVLSKIASKPRFNRPEFEDCLRDIELSLDYLASTIFRDNEKDVMGGFDKVERSISCLDKKDPRFVIDLITKGKLKMAATFYAQGMSLGVASEMTGLHKQEILDYAGQTMMFERLKDEKSIAERMKIARRLISD